MSAVPVQYVDKGPISYTHTSIIYDIKTKESTDFDSNFRGLAMNFNTKEEVPVFFLLDSLKFWPGKRSYDTLAPTQKTIETAKSWLRDLYCYANSIGAWSEPNLTVSPDAEIVFEWWHGNRKLTTYVTETGAEYIKVWGLDIISEMEDGDARSSVTCQELWSWLMG